MSTKVAASLPAPPRTLARMVGDEFSAAKRRVAMHRFHISIALFMIVHFLLGLAMLVSPNPAEHSVDLETVLAGDLWHFLFNEKTAMALAVCWFSGSVLFQPYSLGRVLLFHLSIVGYVLVSLPFLPNHLVFTGILSLFVLAATLWCCLRHGATSESLARVYASDVLPAARVALLLLYALAVLHKLNADYLNPAVSCGWRLYLSMVGNTGLLPLEPMNPLLLIAGSLAVETAIPLLLIFRRTRMLGVLLGVSFHTFLILHPNYMIGSFSTLVVAMYGLFLPVRGARVFHVVWKRRVLRAVRPRFRRLVPSVVWTAGGGVLLAITLLGLSGDGPLAAAARGVVPVASLTVCLCVILTFAWVYLGAHGIAPPSQRAALLPRWGLGVAALVLIVLNGMSPYLGLKTTTAFSMFSNLRTENGVTNHLLIPVNSQVAAYQNDLVEIYDSSSQWLRDLAAHNDRLVYFEFRRYVAPHLSDPDFYVEYAHAGRTCRIDHGVSTEPIEPIGQIEGRLLHFRPVRIESEPCPCRW